jgi:hypothetical protein
MSSTMQESPKKKSRTTKRNGKTTTTEKRSPTHDEIAQRAQELYVKSGYASGRDEEFWLEAEKQLREEITA